MNKTIYIPTHHVVADGNEFIATYRGATGRAATAHDAAVACACALLRCDPADIELSTRDTRYAAMLCRPSIVFTLAPWLVTAAVFAAGVLVGKVFF